MGGGGRRHDRRSGSRRTGGEAGRDVDSSSESSRVSDSDESPTEGDICIIDETCYLASVKSGPLGSISVGDIHKVTVQGGGLVVLDDSGNVVGSITEPWSGRLKECIELGYEYQAEILSKTGAKCKGRVFNK